MKSFRVLLFVFLASLAFSVKSQGDFYIDSIVVPDTVYSCKINKIKVYHYLGCSNWTVNNLSITHGNASTTWTMTRNESLICYWIIAHMVDSFDLAYPPAGTYTITAKAVGTINGTLSTVVKTFTVVDCCPNSGISSSFVPSKNPVCKGDSVSFVNTSTGTGLNYMWFKDGNKVDSSLNYSTVLNSSGNTWIRLRVDSANTCFRNSRLKVPVIDKPVLNLGKDVNVCPGVVTTLDAGPGFDSLLWNTNETTQSINVTNAGQYSVIATDTSRCAVQYDTVEITHKQSAVVDLGNDTTICDGESLILDATYPFSTYKWQDNSTAATYNVTQAGLYKVEVEYTPTKCVTIDSINVEYDPCTGIEDVSANNISIGPNPFDDVLIFSNRDLLNLNISLFDMQGKLILRESSSKEVIQLNTSNVKTGLYYLNINTGGEVRQYRLIKR